MRSFRILIDTKFKVSLSITGKEYTSTLTLYFFSVDEKGKLLFWNITAIMMMYINSDPDLPCS
jgi:hypothetical protein